MSGGKCPDTTKRSGQAVNLHVLNGQKQKSTVGKRSGTVDDWSGL